METVPTYIQRSSNTLTWKIIDEVFCKQCFIYFAFLFNLPTECLKKNEKQNFEKYLYYSLKA